MGLFSAVETCVHTQKMCNFFSIGLKKPLCFVFKIQFLPKFSRKFQSTGYFWIVRIVFFVVKPI